jgi:NHLM bacteriocin system ABC transporter peptidase/ATP-binding protein
MSGRRMTRRHRTPTVLQMEPVECGAAALAMILEYHGRVVPLEELRVTCGISRDGSTAANVARAARAYGLVAQGYRKDTIDALAELPLPLIVFWDFRHYLVVEGFGRNRVYLNDPASGPRTVTDDQFERSFTGVALTFAPGPDFMPAGRREGTMAGLRRRLRGNETALAFVVLVSVALVLPGLVVPALSRVFVDDVLVRGRQDWLRGLLVGLAATALLRSALTWMQQHYLARLEARLAITASSRFVWHVLRLPFVFFSQRYPGEIGARVALNDLLAQFVSGQLSASLLGLLTMTFYALVMLQYSIPLTALSIAIAAGNLLVLRLTARRIDNHRRFLQEMGKLTGTTMAGLQMIDTLKASGAESDFFARWAGSQTDVLNAQQSDMSTQVFHVAPAFLSAANAAIILGLGGYFVIQGRMTIGMLVAFQSLMASFLEPLTRLVTLGGSLQLVGNGLRRLDDVLQHPLDASAAAPGVAPDAVPPVKLTGELELRGVTFGYSPLAPPLLQDFSLKLTPGARVALVGDTGSGKSTVSKLVTGLYEPWSGEILFDGRPRAELPRPLVTSSLSHVDQDVFLFEGTARENLTLWDATAPDASVIQAARDAAIHDDVASRPGGYECHVEERGRNFSGGQQQRLEIARALVNNPTLLVLDEATSALDPKTEQAIDQNLRRRGCTCLIIAHRLSTIRDCDEIVVMREGRVVERGTHDALASRPGPYADLIRM